MMPESFQAREERVSQALAPAALAVKRTGPGRWNLDLANGELIRAEASLDEDWLQVDLAVGEEGQADALRPAGCWRLLRWNAELGGGAKFVLPPGGRQPRVRVELAIGEAPDAAAAPSGRDRPAPGLAERIALACAGGKSACERFRRGGKAGASARPGQAGPSPADDSPGPDLKTLCREAGWPFNERSSGRLAIELDVRGEPCTAVLGPGQGGRLGATAMLVSCQPMPRRSRQALAVLLLTVGGLVRLARAVAGRFDGSLMAGFAVALEAAPTAEQVADALAALSVACRWGGRLEAETLADEGLAERYLALRGWSP